MGKEVDGRAGVSRWTLCWLSWWLDRGRSVTFRVSQHNRLDYFWMSARPGDFTERNRYDYYISDFPPRFFEGFSRLQNRNWRLEMRRRQQVAPVISFTSWKPGKYQSKQRCFQPGVRCLGAPFCFTFLLHLSASPFCFTFSPWKVSTELPKRFNSNPQPVNANGAWMDHPATIESMDNCHRGYSIIEMNQYLPRDLSNGWPLSLPNCC